MNREFKGLMIPFVSCVIAILMCLAIGYNETKMKCATAEAIADRICDTAQEIFTDK